MTNKEAAQALKNFNNLIEADRLINELGSIVQGSHAHILIKRVIVDMAEEQTTTEALTDHGKAEGDCDHAWQNMAAPMKAACMKCGVNRFDYETSKSANEIAAAINLNKLPEASQTPQPKPQNEKG